jgi:hypothetical protein
MSMVDTSVVDITNDRDVMSCLLRCARTRNNQRSLASFGEGGEEKMRNKDTRGGGYGMWYGKYSTVR